MIKIRETNATDAEGVAQLLKENDLLKKSFPVSKVRTIILHNRGLCFVALEDRKVVGSVFGNHDGALTGHIHKLVTHAGFRRKKVASKLVQKAVQRMKKDGITLIFCHVKRKNSPSIQTLEANGFAKRKTHYLMDIMVEN